MELRADCARCVGLCCVAPAFARSADFAVDKPAGTPCAHLAEDFRCGIHVDLRDRGFAGCTVFDCLGAGQRVTAAFARRDWRTPEVAAPMFAAFGSARQVHELLWCLDEARERAPKPALDAEWARLVDVDPAACDVDAARERVGALLRAASERLRTPPTGESSFPARRVVIPDTASRDSRRGESRIPSRRDDVRRDEPVAEGGHRMRSRRDDRRRGRPRDHNQADLLDVRRRNAGPSRADLVGVQEPNTDLSQADLDGTQEPNVDLSRADLVGVQWRNADLSRASLRGALLLGADLRDTDLRLADLLGADLRGADLRGADLSTSLFVTPMQAAAARGDAATRLPARVPRPPHWPV